jgi:hypothetical protein
MNLRLPVSQLEIEIRQPSGHDDLMLLEASTPDVQLALRLADQVGSMAGGAKPDFPALPVPDLDALLLFLRSRVFGDFLRGTFHCSNSSCGAQVEIGFGIVRYLSHHRPRRPVGVENDMEPGWFQASDGHVSFRIPTVADLLDASSARRPDHALVDLCIRPSDAPPELRRVAERAMDALAPALADEIGGSCPECQTRIHAFFDPLQYVLTELRDQAASVLEDVHTLASVHHWPEAQILALPRARRRQYVELAQHERRTG